MSAYDNDVGRDYAKLINATAREANALIAERKRLIKLMENSGWMIYESRRGESMLAQVYAPIIHSIKRMQQTVLEIEDAE